MQFTGAGQGEGNFALGDDGSVAFLGGSQASAGQAAGLYVVDAPGGTPLLVIRPGDDLFGSRVQHVGLRTGALNANGEIAFSYRLNNGVEGIAIAVIPEPGTLGLLAIGGLGLLRRRRR